MCVSEPCAPVDDLLVRHLYSSQRERNITFDKSQNFCPAICSSLRSSIRHFLPLPRRAFKGKVLMLFSFGLRVHSLSFPPFKWIPVMSPATATITKLHPSLWVLLCYKQFIQVNTLNPNRINLLPHFATNHAIYPRIKFVSTPAWMF